MSEETTNELNYDYIDKQAAVKTPYLMRKADYLVSPYSGYIMRRRNTHIPLKREQALFVMKNAQENGPKVALFLATTAGMADDVAAKAWADLMAKEGAPKAAAPASAPPAPAAVETGGNGIKAALDALPEKADVIAYAVEKLGVKAEDIKATWGRERIVEFVLSAVSK
jgi:hypothetical protein